jgi:hypothetical protein
VFDTEDIQFTTEKGWGGGGWGGGEQQQQIDTHYYKDNNKKEMGHLIYNLLTVCTSSKTNRFC